MILWVEAAEGLIAGPGVLSVSLRELGSLMEIRTDNMMEAVVKVDSFLLGQLKQLLLSVRAL